MKKSLFISGMIFLHSLMLQAITPIIPEPLKMKVGSGELFFSSYEVKTRGFEKPPVNLLKLLDEIKTVSKPSKKGKNTLMLELKADFDMHPEGYLLKVNEKGINITAKTEAGIFYGMQSLLQLINFNNNLKEIKLPFLTIEDYPRFDYRGMSLDVGRHFFPVSFIKQYIDLMSSYKLNTLHWHLTEDQGWRIEIKKYPRLTQVGAFREQTLLGRGREKMVQYDNTPYGGFYTQDEVREVVTYAASKHITVIPEIEMPGHSLAALAAYPELACGDNPGPFKVAQRWGIFEDVYCAGKEQTFHFLQDVLDEVMTLFPGKYIHIGGDECPKTKWKTCNHCQERIKTLQLKDEHELQSYFISRMEKYLNEKGRAIIGWDEILEGGLAPNATVMSWRGEKGGIEAARQQHNVIMTPNTYLYFDYRQSKSTEEPLNIGGYLPLKTVYNYNPVSAELSDAYKKYIVGVQANIWTEFMKTPEKVLYMILPRMLALSEVAWTEPALKNETDFMENRIPWHLGKIDRDGLMYRVPEPIGINDTTIFTDKYTVDLKIPVHGAKIYYTLDGYIPQTFDFQYKDKFDILIPADSERILKSVVVTPSGKRSVVVTSVFKNSLNP